MTWLKVDDALPRHPKVLSIPRGARRLAAVGAWTLCGAWSAGALKDGFIPGSVVAELAIGKQVVTDLTDCGLWREVPGGFVMHDYLAYNPPASKVLADREAAAERQRKAREAAKERRDKQTRTIGRAV